MVPQFTVRRKQQNQLPDSLGELQLLHDCTCLGCRMTGQAGLREAVASEREARLRAWTLKDARRLLLVLHLQLLALQLLCLRLIRL